MISMSLDEIKAVIELVDNALEDLHYHPIYLEYSDADILKKLKRKLKRNLDKMKGVRNGD